MKHLLLACLLATGCGVRMQDPCAGVASACLAIQVDRSATLTDADSLSLWLALDGAARPSQLVGDGKQLALPVAIGVLFDSLPSTAQLSVAVTGKHDGVAYRSQTVVRTLTPGQHATVRVQLTAQ
ncbi:MAG TPA: hypothetical protein VIA18_07070, partial [Polyangia bacterium]|nr:hypothetical protein [Polyangia bacterium]